MALPGAIDLVNQVSRGIFAVIRTLKRAYTVECGGSKILDDCDFWFVFLSTTPDNPAMNIFE